MNTVNGDPQLAQVIDQIRGARFELEAANAIEGKTDDEVRAMIHAAYKRAKTKPGANSEGDALLEALNDRKHAQATVAAVRGRA